MCLNETTREKVTGAGFCCVFFCHFPVTRHAKKNNVAAGAHVATSHACETGPSRESSERRAISSESRTPFVTCPYTARRLEDGS